jgi:hypothetical protein
VWGLRAADWTINRALPLKHSIRFPVNSWSDYKNVEETEKGKTARRPVPWVVRSETSLTIDIYSFFHAMNTEEAMKPSNIKNTRGKQEETPKKRSNLRSCCFNEKGNKTPQTFMMRD